MTYRTSIGHCDPETITLLGHDLAASLLGQISFGELAFWLVALRRPSAGEARVFEAVLVALADHGLTPSALAARLTLTGAPESIQGAMAAGILGGGSRFLGVTEDSGRFLTETLTETLAGAPRPSDLNDEAGWDALARTAVTRQRAAGRFVPGLGHTMHKDGDPRTPVLIRLARESGTYGPHLALFEAIGRTHAEVLGRTLPLNGAGVCGAALADLGFEPAVLRGFALLARAAGILGHLAEEQRDGIGMAIYQDVEAAVEYRAPS